ncbi:MAG: GNAT family protein [Chloroflexota bacterium]
MSEPDGRPILNIVGEKVALGPIRRDLLPLYERWINDFEVTRTLEIGWRPTSTETELAWFERAVSASGQVFFTIYERSTLRPIGNADLVAIDHHHGTASFGIMIGEKECWGRGYGTEATRLVLDYAFNGLHLHNVYLTAYAINERGLRAYRRAGFKEFGRRREARLLGSRRYDVVYMDCLATEFQSPLLGQVAEP